MSPTYLWISSEGAQVDLAGRDCPHWIDDDGHEGLLELLVEHLCADVYA